MERLVQKRVLGGPGVRRGFREVVAVEGGARCKKRIWRGCDSRGHWGGPGYEEDMERFGQ